MKTPIPVNTPYFGGNEKQYLNECIDTGWISSEGPFVKRFEDQFSKYVDRRHGIAVANGTAALDIAIQAIKLNKGDEVIIPSFCIISPASAVHRQGGIPIFVDCEENGFNASIQAIERSISPKTKVIIAVHIYNFPVDMDPLIALCEKHNLILIEDAAELIGGEYKGRKCGSFGMISTFSFYANKHITTGEGGMICTNDDELAQRCRSLRNLCFQPEKRFFHEEIGWNYRITNLQAAVGLAQLEQIDFHLQRKKEIGRQYTELLSGVDHLLLPTETHQSNENVYWVYPIIATESCPFSIQELKQFLDQNKIGTRPFFYPLNEQPVFKHYGLNTSCPNAQKLFERGIYIPSGLGLTDHEIVVVADSIKQFVSNYVKL